MTIFYLIFFLLTLFSSILLIVFGTLIFRRTKGFMDGWRYLALYAIGLAAVSLFGIGRVVTEENPPVQATIMFCLAIAATFTGIMLALGGTGLLKDLGITPKVFKKKWVLLFFGVFSFIVFAYNVGKTQAISARAMYTTMLWVMGFSHLIAGGYFHRIYKMTKKRPWIFLFIGMLLGGLSMVVLVYTGSCCVSQDFAMTGQCVSINAPFDYIFPQYCSSAIILFNRPFYAFLVLASIALAAAYFLVCKEFFNMFSGKKDEPKEEKKETAKKGKKKR